jgi:hypothetical protein
VFTIADQGKGWIRNASRPLAPENLLRGTGRGIFLIRSFMDEVHFRQLHPGTELTLVKASGAGCRKNLGLRTDSAAAMEDRFRRRVSGRLGDSRP